MLTVRAEPGHDPRAMGFGIYELYRLVQPGFRRQRLQVFLEALRPGPLTRILDVGGYVDNWEGVVPIESPVTLLNLSLPPNVASVPKRYTCLAGDGRKMNFPDGSFDIVFSNSVIEHVGSFEDQKRFAAEVRRVGKKIYLQTPNRWFFIEPHFVTVFVHFLPWSIARRLIRFCSYRGWVRSGDNIDLKRLAEELRLLSGKELKELFPDCEIHRERLFGMTKSFMVVRR